MQKRLVRSTAVTLAATLCVVGLQSSPATAGDENADPKATEQWEPVPPVVTPGITDGAPLSNGCSL